MIGMQPTLGKHKPISEETEKIRCCIRAYRRIILRKSGINKPQPIIK